jgi:predicted DNA-binding transcriptional regulator YafY
LGNYIRNQPLHSSQVILADNETEFRIGLELVINHELQNLVLSYGADLTVVSPVHFRNAIRQELQKAIGYYLDQPPRQL